MNWSLNSPKDKLGSRVKIFLPSASLNSAMPTAMQYLPFLLSSDLIHPVFIVLFNRGLFPAISLFCLPQKLTPVFM